LVFSLDVVPFLFNLANAFELYRIDAVDVVYKPIISEVNASHASVEDSAYTVPDLVYAFTPYSEIPTSYASAAQRGDATIVSSLERWNVLIHPVPLIRGYDSALADGFLNLGPQWINTAQPDVPHYGFNVVMEPTIADVPSPALGGRVTVHYRVSFKNPRPDGA